MTAIDRSLFFIAAPMLALISMGSPAAPRGPTSARPVLLELFTSQSCSSCPPADAYLGELAQRSDVLALSFHVDYWNGLGWHDRLSSAKFTELQQFYASRLGSNVYTPQLIIDGAHEAVGSDRQAIDLAIRGTEQTLQNVPLKLEKHDRDIEVHFTDPQGLPSDAELLLVTFDPSVTQAIGGGENSGHTLTYRNVARSIRVLKTALKEKVSITLQDDETGARVALIVQEHAGQVIGIAATP